MSKVQRFWCDEARNIRCVREDDFDALAAEAQALREEVAALRARVVVVPERLTNGDSISRMLREIGCDGDVSYHHAREIWNACLDELALLNGKTVSEGLLRLTLEFIMATNYKGSIPLGLIEELRALLNQDKENGNG
ncbi:hypothetical protein [Pseudomonas aeruginosa]|uniref:hypothetical protein n=1 Tax=Pseudomonas aeruginosa TaxID=287 RepID=UPI00068A9498|nr:hypothetical protein [Pseudomonas aeruginosa]HCL3371385.1 hypothetical protein [Pseudomonas aeruginosa]HCU2535379.1 hypothetical protein [Pseudomonas aeruginosa]